MITDLKYFDIKKYYTRVNTTSPINTDKFILFSILLVVDEFSINNTLTIKCIKFYIITWT